MPNSGGPRLVPQSKYSKQRSRVTPPHIPVSAIRTMLGLTLEQVVNRAADLEPDYRRKITIGALSGIEHGHRGASQDMLALLEKVYGLPGGCMATNYVPRDRELRGETAVPNAHRSRP